MRLEGQGHALAMGGVTGRTPTPMVRLSPSFPDCPKSLLRTLPSPWTQNSLLPVHSTSPLVLPHFTAPTSRHIPPVSIPSPWAAEPRAGSSIQASNPSSLQEAVPGTLPTSSQTPGRRHLPVPSAWRCPPHSPDPPPHPRSWQRAGPIPVAAGPAPVLCQATSDAAGGRGLVCLPGSLSLRLPGSQACGLQSLLGALAPCQGSFSYLHRNENLSEIKVLGWL